MPPCFSEDNRTNVRLLGPEPLGDFVLLNAEFIESADIENVAGGEDGVAVRLAPRLTLPLHLVGNIVGVGTEEQVGGVYAGRVVATVTDDHSGGDVLSVVDFPRYGVCFSRLCVAYAEHSVALVGAAGPFPALVGFAWRSV